MPYGCLDPENLSEASQKALDKALERWQASMEISRPRTFLVLASHDDPPGPELELKRREVARHLTEDEVATRVISITARNEEELALKIARNKAILPIQTLIVFAESRHALTLRPIFKRRFGKSLEIKKFKADFEFSHPWIATSSSITWFFRNLILGAWVESKKKLGRGFRKKIKFLFGP